MHVRFCLCPKFFLLFLEVYWHRKLAESWNWYNCINLDSIEAVKIVGIDMYIHKQINTKWLIYNTFIDVKVIFPGVSEQISGGDWQLILSKDCLHRSIQCVEEWKRKMCQGKDHSLLSVWVKHSVFSDLAAFGFHAFRFQISYTASGLWDFSVSITTYMLIYSIIYKY